MEYLATVAILIALYVILAASYNLVIGYGGLATVAQHGTHSVNEGGGVV